MATLFDISLRLLNRLQGLDPLLDDNYADILTVIFYILDKDSQRILLSNSLNQKGIFYDESKKSFFCVPPKTLTQLLDEGIPKELSDQKFVRIIKRMKAFLDNLRNAEQVVDAYDFAGQLESLSAVFLEYELQLYSEKSRAFYRAFLYELSLLADDIPFSIAENRRGINDKVLRVFLKEVYIKHEIYGINFCAWDADDLDGLEINLPEEIKTQIKDRKLSVVESQRFWFLVAPTNSINANRYSLCRFLEEDRDFGLYITYGCFLPKSKLDDPEVLQVILKLISTIYTLEKAISPSLIKFIEDSKQAHYRHIAPLLRQKVLSKGNFEDSVRERMIGYEKKLSSLVLTRMTAIMQNPLSDSDFFIFSHHSQKILGDLWRDLEAFSMLPVAEFSESAKIMCNRLMAYRLLIQKNLNMLCDSRQDWSEKLALLKQPYEQVNELYQETAFQMEELLAYEHKAKHYEERKQQGSFFAKIGIGKPKYDLQTIADTYKAWSSEFFMKIIRLAKEHRQHLVYCEFENPYSVGYNEDYRHYAMAYSKNAIDRLPMMIRLPENRANFEMAGFQENLESVKRYEML